MQTIDKYFSQNFHKFLKLKISIAIIWYQYENWIQMSTNKPSIGPVVLKNIIILLCLKYFKTYILTILYVAISSAQSIKQYSLRDE